MELAKDTVDILNEKGWKQGPASLGDDTRLCLGEAIGEAAMNAVAASQEEEVQQVEQMTKLRLAIEANIPSTNYINDSWSDIIQWNDKPGRTKQDVMEILDKTIDILVPAVT